MLKILLKSISVGIVIPLLSVALIFLTENRALARVLLFPITFLEYLAGPKSVMGYGPNGEALVEGTPLDLFIVLLGFLLCFLVYSIIGLVFFLIYNRFSKKELESAQFMNN
jgi:hypothetical protein